MKIAALILLICAGALALAAGCAGEQPAPPATVPVTTAPAATTATPTPVTTATAAVVPPDLLRPWTLTLMAQNGADPVAPCCSPVTLSLRSDMTLAGNGGCNDYSAGFTLAPASLKSGAITIGPITSTKIFCNRVAAQENTYFAILQQASAYDVSIDTLRIIAADGSYLVFRTGTS